jgi:hypothetical protein
MNDYAVINIIAFVCTSILGFQFIREDFAEHDPTSQFGNVLFHLFLTHVLSFVFPTLLLPLFATITEPSVVALWVTAGTGAYLVIIGLAIYKWLAYQGAGKAIASPGMKMLLRYMRPVFIAAGIAVVLLIIAAVVHSRTSAHFEQLSFDTVYTRFKYAEIMRYGSLIVVLVTLVFWIPWLLRKVIILNEQKDALDDYHRHKRQRSRIRREFSK